LNLSGSYDWSDKILIRTGIENIFDTHYREFASGISAPGRSLILGLSVEL
jgi:hemoglobin/transferrin/lactoferrin receptor protein